MEYYTGQMGEFKLQNCGNRWFLTTSMYEPSKEVYRRDIQ